MKKIASFILFTGLLTGAVYAADAQTKFSEGKIVFDITYPGTDLDQNMMAMMPTDATIYVKKDMSRMEMKMGMGSMVAISDAKSGTTTTLMDMMGQKIAMKITPDDLKKEKEKSGKPQVQITDETKDIAGYKCRKAIVTTTTDGKDKYTFNVWFTKDIEAKNSAKNQIEGIDGFMMEFETKQQGMTIKMTAQSVTPQPVDDSMFVIPDGYKQMTMDDMKKMGGGR
jgi:GLPGLI family protein